MRFIDPICNPYPLHSQKSLKMISSRINSKILNMKKVLFTLAVLGALSFTTAQAQTRLGLMLGVGTEIDQPAIGGNAEFFITKKLALAPSLLFYFPESHGNWKYSWYEVNFDAHYYFYNKNIFEFYGVGGLNYTHFTVKYKPNDEKDGEGDIGLNIGGGINFDLKAKGILPFSEIKYIFEDIDQAVIVAGIKFTLN